MVYQNVITGIMLIVCTLEDLADRNIRSSSLILFSVLVLIGKPEEMLAGSVPGIVCLLLSWLSSQSLGYGDSFVILICGIALGPKQGSRMVIYALSFAGIWSAAKIVRGRIKRSSELPFLPFLLAGWILTVWITYGTVEKICFI